MCARQVIRTANAEVAKGLQNPAYKFWQKLPGAPSKGQVAITKFHSIMNSLLQEVITPLVYVNVQLHCVLGGLRGFNTSWE